MSNSSDPLSVPQDPQAETPLVRLLRAMAIEWSAIAGDLETLGTVVSEAGLAARDAEDVRALQAFDLLQQRAAGQSKLLVRLTRKIRDDHVFDRKRLDDMVADIPFHAVRADLQAAFDGQAQARDASADGDEVDWF